MTDPVGDGYFFATSGSTNDALGFLVKGLNANVNIASYDLNNKINIFNPDIHFVGTWDCDHASGVRVRIAYFAGRYLIDETVNVNTPSSYSNPHTHNALDN